MRIVCLVKQIPHPAAIDFDQETKTLKREGVPLELNELDRHALAEAVRLREWEGGEVVAMTMGPPQAEDALRECIALGADRAVHLSDHFFAVADTLGTSRTLALAIQKEPADLVLCGRKTLDSETWQVPPEIAAHLGWPVLTSVVGLEPANGWLRATRETDEGEEVWELEAPAVLSIARSEHQARLRNVLDGRVDLWTASDLVPDVRPNDKRFGQTGSPTRVLAVRDVTPERAGAAVSSPEEAADLILARVAEMSAPPASWDKPERLGEQPGKSYDCWAFVELVAGRPTRLSLELLGKGRELAGKLGGRNVALVVGHGLEAASIEAARYGADGVYVVDDASLAQYHPELYATALRLVLERYRPHVLLFPASARGREVGPLVAGRLGLGMTGDCVDLGIDRAGRLIQFKPAYGGNIVSVIMGATTPQLATVRPRVFEPVEPREVRPDVHKIPFASLPETRLRLVESRRESAAYELDEAGVVVGVGAGIAAAEVEPLARELGAAVGGTRSSSVAAGRRIGLLGRPIAPRLYIAVGTEAGFEHATGTVKAKVIAAVASDPELPADVRLEGDRRETLPALVDALAGRL